MMALACRFVTALIVEELDARNWRTHATLSYDSLLVGRIDVPTDFITDFASVPRTPILWWFAGDIGRKAAVVHDWLYQRHEILLAPITKELADRVFLEALGACGIWAWRRYPMYQAVVMFGHSAWNSGPRRFATLNPKWTAQEQILGHGQFTPARDVRVPPDAPTEITP